MCLATPSEQKSVDKFIPEVDIITSGAVLMQQNVYQKTNDSAVETVVI